jgi:formylglycine-generating enzyme required for sulfatase activity
LPSEKEWEFAARGGVHTQGFTYSGSNDLNAVGWYKDNGGTVNGVGKKLANELGIFDMTGNLEEWTWDLQGSDRSFRGGNWFSFAESCEVADRYFINPEYRNNARGFRVALSSVP